MTLESKLEMTLGGLGYELVDFSYSVKSGLMRVFIDQPEGISLEDCERVSHHLDNWLAVENVSYERLEVSSPGMDRPIKRWSDYQRFIGRQVQIRLRMALAGQRRFMGTIVSSDERTLVLMVDGREMILDMSNIDQSRLVPEL
jgi:ribosome maturation factor RimP